MRTPHRVPASGVAQFQRIRWFGVESRPAIGLSVGPSPPSDPGKELVEGTAGLCGPRPLDSRPLAHSEPSFMRTPLEVRTPSVLYPPLTLRLCA